MAAEVSVDEVFCSFCGKSIVGWVGKNFFTGRKYCGESCRRNYWRCAKVKTDRSKVKKYDPKEAEASWLRILAKRDPVTHRYRP